MSRVTLAALRLAVLNVTMSGESKEVGDLLNAHIEDLEEMDAEARRSAEKISRYAKIISSLSIDNARLKGQVQIAERSVVEDASSIVVGVIKDICNGLDLDINGFDGLAFEEVAPHVVGLIVQKYAAEKVTAKPEQIKDTIPIDKLQPWRFQFIHPDIALKAFRMKLDGKSPVDIRTALGISMSDWKNLDDKLLRARYATAVVLEKEKLENYLGRLHQRWLSRWSLMKAEETKEAA